MIYSSEPAYSYSHEIYELNTDIVNLLGNAEWRKYTE